MFLFCEFISFYQTQHFNFLVLYYKLSKAIQFSQTVLIQTIQFSISTQFSSIWPIDKTLSGTRVNMGVMTMKGYSTFPKATALLEPHHPIVLCYIKDTHWRWGGLTPLQRCSQYNLHPQLTGQATAWKKSCFILSDRSDFHMIKNLSIVVYAFAGHMLCGVWRYLGGQWLRARLCCRKISDSIFWLYYFTPRWLAGVMPCPKKVQKKYTKRKDRNR